MDAGLLEELECRRRADGVHVDQRHQLERLTLRVVPDAVWSQLPARLVQQLTGFGCVVGDLVTLVDVVDARAAEQPGRGLIVGDVDGVDELLLVDGQRERLADVHIVQIWECESIRGPRRLTVHTEVAGPAMASTRAGVIPVRGVSWSKGGMPRIIEAMAAETQTFGLRDRFSCP